LRLPADQDYLDLANAFKAFIQREAPLTRNIQVSLSGTGFDREAYRQMATLGFLGDSGRMGANVDVADFSYLAPICYLIGYELLSGPWVENMLAARVLALIGTEERAMSFSAGKSLYSIPLRLSDWSALNVAPRRTGCALTGQIRALGFATQVDAWFLPAKRVDGTTTLTAMPANSDNAIPLRSLDPLWRGSMIMLDGHGVDIVGPVDQGRVRRILSEGTAMLSMAAVGAAQRLLDLSVQYLKTRRAFGRTIGSFQALKHRAADQLIAIEHSQNLALAAFRDESASLVVAAKISADLAYRRSAEFAMQVHGASGYTWELPVHYFLKNSVRQALIPMSTAEHGAWLRDLLFG
jgi:Acyl-CoA dehydrogenase, C-terminal domain